MLHNNREAKRSWRRSAVELVTETNPARFQQLTEELVKAVDLYNRSLPHHSRKHAKPKKAA